MSEHLPKSAEKQSQTQSAELEKMAAEKIKSPEKSSVERPEQKAEQVEHARKAVEKAEQPVEQGHGDKESVQEVTFMSGISRRMNFDHTMRSLQLKMQPTSRMFSEIIHNPVIERVSEGLGKTVLRPSVSLGATTTALIVVGVLYFTARHYGFALRGSELLITLIVGGIIGLILEALIKLLRRAR
jgi:hypothetical protein